MREDQIDPEDGIITKVPDGLKVIGDLPNEMGTTLVADELYTITASRRTYLEEIIKQGLVGNSASLFICVRNLIREAGESEYAEGEWRELYGSPSFRDQAE